jgi:C1A family cysteine protease
MTSKTNSCVVPYYPLKGTQAETIAFLKEQAKEHKADGYAKVTTWEGLKDAINKYGCVLCAINIFENYGDDNCVGNFPDPKGEVVGSHAMCAYGYDDDLEEVYFIHSWGGRMD